MNKKSKFDPPTITCQSLGMGCKKCRFSMYPALLGDGPSPLPCWLCLGQPGYNKRAGAHLYSWADFGTFKKIRQVLDCLLNWTVPLSQSLPTIMFSPNSYHGCIPVIAANC